MKPQPIPTFLSYAHEDKKYKKRLLKHLAKLIHNEEIAIWQDKEIKPGDRWDATIKKQLTQSQLILFLISADFLASNYIKEVELEMTLQMEKRKDLKVVPIMIKPADIESSQLYQFQLLPENGKPISTWKNKEEAWMDVVKQIKRILPDLKAYFPIQEIYYKYKYLSMRLLWRY